MMMDWRMVSTIVSLITVITALGGLFNYLLNQRLRADFAETREQFTNEMAGLKESVSKRAETDRREVERWAEDRFIRADLMDAKLDGIGSRLRVIELQLERERERQRTSADAHH